jgi:hypothetical protein
MGWGVNDYPTKHETTERCFNGCDKHYECAAKACTKDNLCVHEAYICADCDQDFCVGHVMDVAAPGDANVRFVCLPCVGKVVVLAVAA